MQLSQEKKEAYLGEAEKIASLVIEKQEAYGDSFGRADKVILELYPNGISPEQMPDALTLIRVIDKIFRIANKKNAFGESPYKDIMGYALLAVVRDSNVK
jgi:hypothetical protein